MVVATLHLCHNDTICPVGMIHHETAARRADERWIRGGIEEEVELGGME